MLSILMIGNSFSADAIQYIGDMVINAGQKDVYLGNLYIGGCSLQTHAANARANAKSYHYFLNQNGVWNRSTDSFPEDAQNTSILDAIQSHNWDYICLQQVSGSSGEANTYNADLDYMIEYVQTHAPGTKLLWHMTWAYQQDSLHPHFPRYNSDQMTMYHAIVSAVQSRIIPKNCFEQIIPAGTAVQNSRTSYLGDTTTIDGFHMNRSFGRYLVALMFIRCLTDLKLEDITVLPDGMDEQQRRVAIESVNNAYARPFEVTQSQYKI